MAGRLSPRGRSGTWSRSHYEKNRKATWNCNIDTRVCGVKKRIALSPKRRRTSSKNKANGACDFSMEEVRYMLGWAITFLIIALIAAVFGFGGIAAASAGI